MEQTHRQNGFPRAVVAFGRHGSAAARGKLEELRGLLAERFPGSRQRTEEVLPTGFAPLDEAGGGGAPRAAVSEVVASAPSCGGQFLVSSLLKTARRTYQYLALVDGADGFDPQTEEEDLLPRPPETRNLTPPRPKPRNARRPTLTLRNAIPVTALHGSNVLESRFPCALYTNRLQISCRSRHPGDFLWHVPCFP